MGSLAVRALMSAQEYCISMRFHRNEMEGLSDLQQRRPTVRSCEKTIKCESIESVPLLAERPR